MGCELPQIARAAFAQALSRESPQLLSAGDLERLYLHYTELRRWNRRLSLVGPGTSRDLLVRHYGESLAALPLLGDGPRVLVDVGSGAGFPGLVLALVRPDLEVTLIEARERKWSFLSSVCRKAALSCRCLNARVGPAPVRGLPVQIDVITSRAVRLEHLGLESLLPTLAPDGRCLLWWGALPPQLPAALEVRSQVRLSGSRERRILEIMRRQETGETT